MKQPPCCVGKQNYQEPEVEAELNLKFFEFYHYIFLITIWAHAALRFHT